MARLRKKDITLLEVYKLSLDFYKSGRVDNKKRRMRLDVKSAKLVKRKRYEFDKGKKKWVQVGTEAVFHFLVSSKPVSYKKIDNIAIHRYPVIIALRDVSLGFMSPVKLRTGSEKKPKFYKKGDDAKRVAELNIRNGVQMQFIIDSSWVYQQYGILFGRNWSRKPPTISNKKLNVFMSKHELFVVEKYMKNLLSGKSLQMIIDKVITQK